MTKHDLDLWRVRTTSPTRPQFYVPACCAAEAANKGEAWIGSEDVVVSVKCLEWPLIVDGEDDDPDEDDADPPVEAKVAAASAPASKAN